MPNKKTSNKQKVDLQNLANKAWEYYQNYLDSTQDEQGNGDYDELQKLITLAAPLSNQSRTSNKGLLLPMSQC
jgi:hypothetical protein